MKLIRFFLLSDDLENIINDRELGLFARNNKYLYTIDSDGNVKRLSYSQLDLVHQNLVFNTGGSPELHGNSDIFVDSTWPNLSSGARVYQQLTGIRSFVSTSARSLETTVSTSAEHDYNVVGELHVQRLDATGFEIAGSSELEIEAGSGSEKLSWSHGSGSTLLDYTDPQFPNFNAAGIFAVTAHFGWTLV